MEEISTDTVTTEEEEGDPSPPVGGPATSFIEEIEEDEEEDVPAIDRELPSDPTSLDISRMRENIARNSEARAPFVMPKASALSGRSPDDGEDGFDHGSFLEDSSDGRVRTLDDIMARYPIGDGEHYIYVERRQPKISRGVHIEGIQKSVTEKMDHTDFAKMYGAGSYILTVYGPSKTRRLDASGKLQRRAFTKPIKLDVPDPYGENPPNPEMAAIAKADEDEDDMAQPNILTSRRAGATDADADIVKSTLEHERLKEQHEVEKEERRRAREEQEKRDAEEKKAVESASQFQMMKELVERRDKEIADLRKASSSSASELATLIQAMRPEGPSKDEISRLGEMLADEKRRSTEEISRLKELHSAEVSRLQDQHRQEVDRIRSENDRINREDRERQERSMKDREEHLRREIESVRNQGDRALTDARAQFEARLNDERRQHDRDLLMRTESSRMEKDTVTTSFDMRLEVVKTENIRLVEENSKLQKELAEEKKKTLADRVDEFAGAAEALGYTKDDGGSAPGDWKSMLADAAVGFVKQAPSLASNVMATLQAAKMPQQQGYPQYPPSLPGAGAFPGQFTPAFATDGVEVDLDDPVPPQTFDDMSSWIPQAPSMPQQPPQPQQAAMIPTNPQPQNPPVQQQGASQTPQQPTPDGSTFKDSDIVEFSSMFRQALEEGVEPEEVSKQIVQMFGAPMAGTVVRQLTLQRVVGVLKEEEDGDSDPLVRKDGQQFLQKVWELILKAT